MRIYIYTHCIEDNTEVYIYNMCIEYIIHVDLDISR